jgi:Anti-sigma-K factor rskA
MSTPDAELDSLLGAYALDAVDELERGRIDRYLAASPRARAELDDHLRVAMMLGNSAGPAPASVWELIDSKIRSTQRTQSKVTPALLPLTRPSVSPTPSPTNLPRPSSTSILPRRRPFGLGLAAAACVAALMAVSTITFNQSRRINNLQASVTQAQTDAKRERERVRNEQTRIAALERELISSSTADARVTRLLSTASGRVVELQAGDAAVGRVVFDPLTGEGFIISTALKALPKGRTYQLWGVHGETVLSLGVLGQRPATQGFSADGTWSAFVVTEEASPGVASSKNPAFAVAKVVTA